MVCFGNDDASENPTSTKASWSDNERIPHVPVGDLQEQKLYSVCLISAICGQILKLFNSAIGLKAEFH